MIRHRQGIFPSLMLSHHIKHYAGSSKRKDTQNNAIKHHRNYFKFIIIRYRANANGFLSTVAERTWCILHICFILLIWSCYIVVSRVMRPVCRHVASYFKEVINFWIFLCFSNRGRVLSVQQDLKGRLRSINAVQWSYQQLLFQPQVERGYSKDISWYQCQPSGLVTF